MTYVSNQCYSLQEAILFATRTAIQLSPRCVIICFSMKNLLTKTPSRSWANIRKFEVKDIQEQLKAHTIDLRDSMNARQTYMLPRYQTYFLLSDIPDLERYTNAQVAALELEREFHPDYTLPRLGGTFIESARFLHCHMFRIAQSLDTICKGQPHVKVLFASDFAPRDFRVPYYSHFDQESRYPRMPSWNQCWYHDGLNPNALGIIVFNFT